jgi:hypothetical protein
MENKNPKPLLGKAPLTMLNINKFKITEAMGLKNIALRSPWVSLYTYEISWKFTKQFQSY